MTDAFTPAQRRRRGYALGPALGLAALFLLDIRARLPEGWRPAYASYFADVAVPFVFYFLLCREDVLRPRLRPWWAKAGVVFGGCTVAEVAQGLGFPLLGRTYDPVDLAMYAAGVLLAALVAHLVLPPAAAHSQAAAGG